MIELYTAPTPNGWKVSIALEEMQLPYEVTHVDIMAGEQHAESFRRINPNGKIPAIIDRAENNLALMESGAILLYLAEKSGKLMPADTAGRYEVVQWLMFQMAGLGPMQGQANVFHRYFPERIQSVTKRYQNETKRLYAVLEQRLAGRDYLCGDYSIADIASWSWVCLHEWAGIDVSDLPNVQAWLQRLSDRPAVQRGRNVPVKMDLDANDAEKTAEIVNSASKILTR